MSVANGSFTRTNSFGKDEDNTFARFYFDAIKNEAASAQAGREIWEDVEMVEIILPGNPWTKPVMRVTDEHRERWPKLYEQFRKQEEQRPDGRPIEEWSEVSRAMVKELKALDFYTVEQVADMSEIAIGRIGMGARVLKEKAQAYVAESRKMAPINALVRENDILKSKLSAMESNQQQTNSLLEQLQAQLSDLRNAPNGVAASIPGRLDPAQAAGYRQLDSAAAPQPTAGSSLDRLARKARPATATAPSPGPEAPPPNPRRTRAKKTEAAAA
jgi:hypothetical protein